MKKFFDVAYDCGEKNKLDAYLPDGKELPIIIYFHGGGLEAGDKGDENFREIGESFADSGYGFISVNYRLYGDGATFPDYINDCAKAIAYIKKNLSHFSGNGQIFVAGQSAGAWIALMLCLNPRYLNALNLSPLDISGWIIDSAQTTSHFNVIKRERGDNPLLQRIDEYAPLYYVDNNTRFTRMLMMFYREDMPCRPEQNRLFVSAVSAFNQNADIRFLELPGEHCHGSSVKDSDGQYPFVKETLKWLEHNS